jgi:hypothetical protein
MGLPFFYTATREKALEMIEALERLEHLEEASRLVVETDGQSFAVDALKAVMK